MKKIRLYPFLIPQTILKFKWIKDSNIKPEALQIPYENISKLL